MNQPQQNPSVAVSEAARAAAVKLQKDWSWAWPLDELERRFQLAINVVVTAKDAEIEEWRKVLTEVKAERDASQVDCIKLRTELAEAITRKEAAFAFEATAQKQLLATQADNERLRQALTAVETLDRACGASGSADIAAQALSTKVLT